MCDSCSSKRALELAEEIEDLADEIFEKFFHENSDAMDFADSVKEMASSIADWVEKNDHVTDTQLSALENTKAGAERWLE